MLSYMEQSFLGRQSSTLSRREEEIIFCGFNLSKALIPSYPQEGAPGRIRDSGFSISYTDYTDTSPAEAYHS